MFTGTLSDWRSAGRNLTLENIANIARALKVWPGDLFDHFPKPK